MTPNPQLPLVREQDPGSWWYLLHTKLYRYRALLRKYWWIVLFTGCAGLAMASWKVAQQEVVYISSARMMVSGKISLPEGVTYTEEMGYFMTTQRELMQDEATRKRAELHVKKLHPEVPVSPVQLSAAPLAQTSIFLLTAIGAEAKYTQYFLDAVMHEFIATRREMRNLKSENFSVSIEEEIERVQKELRSAEDRAIAFQKENNIGFLEAEGNSAGAYLSGLNTQLAELKKEGQLLELFDLDQKLAREETRGDSDAFPKGDPRFGVSSSAIEYRKVRQQLEILRSEKASFEKDLRPAHPIMVELSQLIARNEQLMESYRRQSGEDLERRRSAVTLEIQNLEKTIKEWEVKALALSQRLGEYRGIQSEIERKRGQMESLSKSKGSLEINRNVDQEVVSIRQTATPAAPVKPGVVKTIALGIGMGLLAGALFLLLVDQLDDRVASFTEFQSHFSQRVLTQIPSVGKGVSVAPLAPNDGRHAFAEAFRSLRSSLIFLPVEGALPKILLIASAVPNEGKSTVAVNLAITIALSGAKVLLVDGDLRRGEIHRTFGLANDVGLGNVLRGEIGAAEAAQQTSVNNLFLIPRGASVLNPGELYLGNAADRMLKEVHAGFDYVLFDSSPVMAADDTTSLAPKVDATIMVFRFTSSSARTTRKAISLLRERQANVIGIVCNDVSEAMQEYYYYRYPEYYGVTPPKVEDSKV